MKDPITALMRHTAVWTNVIRKVLHSPKDPKEAAGNALGVYWIFLMVLLMVGGCGGGVKTAHADIVAIAQAQIGHGESGADNRGKWVKTYLNGKEGLPWCAAFVSFVLKQSGKSSVFGYVLSAKEYWAKARSAGRTVKSPQPGDLIVFWRGSRSGHLGHVGIVESVKGGRITTIQGNVGKYPSLVKRITYKNMNEIPKLLGYVRVS